MSSVASSLANVSEKTSERRHNERETDWIKCERVSVAKS
jgi:hypothetical protein